MRLPETNMIEHKRIRPFIKILRSFDMDKEWKTVEVLRHSRHDWLNKLQLIKGNIDLNKMDRVKAVIEEIIIETQHESRLSNLEMPNFVETLLTANWRSFPFRVELEVLCLQHGCHDLDEFMASWTENLLHILAESLDDYGDNVVMVSIDENKDRNLRLSFELQGTIKNESILRDFLNKSKQVHILTELKFIGSEEADFQIEIQCDENK